MSNPQISFKYTHNNKIIYNLDSQSIESRLKSIYGENITDSLIKIEQSSKSIKVNGYVGNLNLVKKINNNKGWVKKKFQNST